MSQRGNPYDNAKAESFMKTLKVEAVHPMAFETFEDPAVHLLSFIGRGDPAVQVGAVDSRIALAVIGLVTALALISIRRLSPQAGSELSGHRAGPGQAMPE